MSLETIKTVEDLSLNAWPSHQMQVYDGWILRFSYFYTHRTNCVEVIAPAQLPIAEKVAYCEQVYAKWGTPCIFKISPLTTPALELFLEERGYEEQHRVDNMVLSLDGIGDSSLPEPVLPLVVGDRVDAEWIDALFERKHETDEMHRKVVPSMYAAIPKDEITVKIFDLKGDIVGMGLGILDRGYVGIYAIHVREDYRRQGLAEAIVKKILSEGAKKGATKAYLQVLSDNQPARHLYEKLGFVSEYECWFRVKETSSQK